MGSETASVARLSQCVDSARVVVPGAAEAESESAAGGGVQNRPGIGGGLSGAKIGSKRWVLHIESVYKAEGVQNPENLGNEAWFSVGFGRLFGRIPPSVRTDIRSQH